jgi:hypothetical protein
LAAEEGAKHRVSMVAFLCSSVIHCLMMQGKGQNYIYPPACHPLNNILQHQLACLSISCRMAMRSAPQIQAEVTAVQAAKKAPARIWRALQAAAQGRASGW